MPSHEITPPPKYIPSPLPYGPSLPDIRMYMRHGRQVFESRTNQNLFLAATDFDAEGTYTMGRFLRTLPECNALHETTACPCLIAGPADGHLEPASCEYASSYEWHTEPDLAACPGINRLLGYCKNSRSQAVFYEKYLTAMRQTIHNLPEALGEAFYAVSDAVTVDSLNRALVAAAFDFPALIPEAWLNAVGPDRTDEDDRHLNENPQRVDFVVFGAGRKAVIEVDGKSHYAIYDEDTGVWTPSEQRYSKNLRIERSLRRQGWGICRFSNLEAQETPIADFRKLVRYGLVPGIDSDKWVDPADLATQLLDIPF